MHVSPHFTRCHLGGVRWVIDELVHLEGGERRVQQVDWQIILPSEKLVSRVQMHNRFYLLSDTVVLNIRNLQQVLTVTVRRFVKSTKKLPLFGP